MIALDVVVAWGLYRVFSPVNRHLSLLAAAFRLVFAAVFLAAVGHLLGALRLLGDNAYLSVFSADQLQAQALLSVTAFNDLWVVALGLFGSTCCSSATSPIDPGTHPGFSASCSPPPDSAT